MNSRTNSRMNPNILGVLPPGSPHEKSLDLKNNSKMESYHLKKFIHKLEKWGTTKNVHQVDKVEEAKDILKNSRLTNNRIRAVSSLEET